MIAQSIGKRPNHRRLSRQLAAVLKSPEADRVVAVALAVLEQRARYGSALTCPAAVRDYLKLSLADRQHEVFVCIWLDAQHRLISMEEMFRGTLTETAIYPREVCKAALAANAAAVIFAHNHPSGMAQPSQADERLTRDLKEVLALIGVRTLDHMVIGGSSVMSFAERGLL